MPIRLLIEITMLLAEINSAKICNTINEMPGNAGDFGIKLLLQSPFLLIKFTF